MYICLTIFNLTLVPVLQNYHLAPVVFHTKQKTGLYSLCERLFTNFLQVGNNLCCAVLM